MRSSRLVLGLVAALLMLGACSDDKDDKASPNTTTAVDSADPGNSEGTFDDGTSDDDLGDEGSADEGSVDEGLEGGSGGSDGDVCSLFSEADAETALGDADLDRVESAVDQSCTYTSVDPVELKMVIVSIQPGALIGNDLGEIVEATGALAGDAFEMEMVPDLGDGAFAMEVVGMPTIMVADGDDIITVTAGGGDVDAAVTLAKVVVGNR